jgi:cytochrome c oxidase cbb3-type subunit 2
MFRWLRDHGVIERNVVLMGVLTLLTVSIGGLVQIVPLFAVETTIERVQGVRPYTPLEQMGRNIYVREGCYVCHSQMIRPFRDELERYGHFSLAAESMHAAHLRSPRAVVPASIMPPYSFLDRPLDYERVADHLRALRAVGVPYSDEMIANAKADLEAQARPDADATAFNARYARARQAAFDGDPVRITEMDALVAYLQMLGTLVDFRDVTPAQLRQQ